MSRPERRPALVITVLGFGQILGWGSSYYLPAVLAQPIAADTGWPLASIVAGLSIGSLTAGLIAHRIGSAIQLRGGRPVMAVGAVLLAAGLSALGTAPSLPLHLLAWVVIGAGMGCALYDAAFATLGSLYGHEARRAIATLTLFGGFASTVCWPLSAFLLEQLGWRGTCLAYAALHLGVTLPLYAWGLPATGGTGLEHRSTALADEAGRADAKPASDRQWLLFGLIAAPISLGWAISSVLSVHLLLLLQARGLELAAAVALGALVGPAQVGGRALEMAMGRHYHPVWTLVIAATLVAVGLLGLLVSSGSAAGAALICYGAGAGIASIARGTLPLAVFGPDRYPLWVGRLAGPTLIAGAVSPALGAALLDWAGPNWMLVVLETLALVNLILALLLWWLTRSAAPRLSREPE